VHTLNVGGAEVLAGNLARRLQDRYRCVFVCLDEPGQGAQRLRDEGFAVEVVGRADGLDWRCPRRLAAIWRQSGADLVQAHQYTPFFYALAARLRYRRPPIVFTEHGRHYPDFPRTRRMVVNRLALEPRDRVVAVGPSVRRALIEYEGIPAGRIQVIVNGVDPDRYSPNPFSRVEMRRQLGLAADAFAVLMVARLDPIKDHVTAIRSCAKAADSVPGLKLFVVGDGPERGSIESFVREQRLDGLVRMLGTRDDVPRLLAAADALLLTSVSEGIPLTVIEGMASGVPVVSTDVGSVAEVLAGGTAGLLAPARDVDALANHLVRLGRSPRLRGDLGGRGRARVEALYSERQMADHYAGLFDSLLARHPASRPGYLPALAGRP
jgi:glycosyltransferase involved in cell wall biosynthesis